MEADVWLTTLAVALIVNVPWDTEEPRVKVGWKFVKIETKHYINRCKIIDTALYYDQFVLLSIIIYILLHVSIYFV